MLTSRLKSVCGLVQVLDEINEQTDQMQQIQDAMAQPIGPAADVDEDELMGELEVRLLSYSLSLACLSTCSHICHHACASTSVGLSSGPALHPPVDPSEVGLHCHGVVAGVPVNEDVLWTLQNLESEQLDDQLLEPAPVPTARPAQPQAQPAHAQAAQPQANAPLPSVPHSRPAQAARPAKSKEEEELEALEREMAV